jgi:hypothetical protein
MNVASKLLFQQEQIASVLGNYPAPDQIKESSHIKSPASVNKACRNVLS